MSTLTTIPVDRRQRRPAHAGQAILLHASLALLASAALAQNDGPELLRTDAQTPYVHRITLYDHDGTAISPADEPARPYSPRTTCGKCHPYAQIRHGWHFNAPNRNVPPGRPGEPWLLVDSVNGSVTAISGRDWPGTVTPAHAGLSYWQFTKRFGRHTPGGGYGEPSDEEIQKSAETARWRISGRLEIDCMMCHSADQQHDPAEHARQIEKENFRWAATAALNLAVVRGEARKAPDDWDPLLPPNPDFKEQAGPSVNYDKTRFDADDRVLFNITRRVPNERCYFCHSTRLVGPGAPETWHTDRDVHLAAGLLCVDCHRHGIDHAMTRGFLGESEHPARATLTCRGCHYGAAEEIRGEEEGHDRGHRAPTSEAYKHETPRGGRLRAPLPLHRGLPPLHLRQLSCTACHSGPWPQPRAQRVQTSLAHGLGIPTRERGENMPPALLEPVFARLQRGADQAGEADALREDPVPQDAAAALVKHDGADEEEQADPIQPCRLVAGPGQGLTDAYRWPFAHNVRPARQSLGAGGCRDCHAEGAPLFFGSVQSPAGAEPVGMAAFHRYPEPLARAWAAAFQWRDLFKWSASACLVLMALVLLRGALAAVPGGHVPVTAAGRVGTAPPAASPPGLARARIASVGAAAAALGTAISAATSFVVEWIGGAQEGWTLLVHMVGGGTFLVGLALAALTWRICDPAQRSNAQPQTAGLPGLLSGLVLLCGFGCGLTMVWAMLPVAGTQTQNDLVELHERSAIGLIITGCLLAVAYATRRAKKGT